MISNAKYYSNKASSDLAVLIRYLIVVFRITVFLLISNIVSPNSTAWVISKSVWLKIRLSIYFKEFRKTKHPSEKMEQWKMYWKHDLILPAQQCRTLETMFELMVTKEIRLRVNCIKCFTPLGLRQFNIFEQGFTKSNTFIWKH